MHGELAKAIKHGYLGDHASAVKNLDAARGHHLGTGDRWAVSPYLIAHTTFQLWDKTGEQAYKNMAVDFARSRSFQYIGYAWPFALLALLSDDVAEQRDAAAKAYYLDRQSNWFSMLPDDLKAHARQVVAEENPFVQMIQEVAAGANTPS